MSNRLLQSGSVFFEVLENRTMLSAAPGVAHHHRAHHHGPTHHAKPRTPEIPGPLSLVAGSGDPIFMQIPGVQGDVSDVNFPNDIAVSSFSWGVARTGGLFGGGASGRAVLGNFNFTKSMDKASPALFQDVVTGKSIPTVTVFLARTTDAGSQTYAKYVFSNVSISSYNVSSGGDTPTESLSLSFTKVQFTFMSPNADGVVTPISVTWDVRAHRLA